MYHNLTSSNNALLRKNKDITGNVNTNVNTVVKSGKRKSSQVINFEQVKTIKKITEDWVDLNAHKRIFGCIF